MYVCMREQMFYYCPFHITSSCNQFEATYMVMIFSCILLLMSADLIRSLWNFRSLYSNWSGVIDFSFWNFKKLWVLTLTTTGFTPHSHFVKVSEVSENSRYHTYMYSLSISTNQWTQIVDPLLMTYRINPRRSTEAAQELSLYRQRWCPVCKQQDPLCHRNECH